MSRQGTISASHANKKQTITDFNYYLGSAKQASDYETTTEFFINHVKKVFDYGNDIGTALEPLEPTDVTPWKPRMQVSTAEAVPAREAENWQFEIEFKADYDLYGKRVQMYENNKTTKYCKTGKRNRVHRWITRNANESRLLSMANNSRASTIRASDSMLMDIIFVIISNNDAVGAIRFGTQWISLGSNNISRRFVVHQGKSPK